MNDDGVRYDGSHPDHTERSTAPGPESDGPAKAAPPANRDPADAPSSPETTPNVHGHPEPPS
jgi:hypothetical protein